MAIEVISRGHLPENDQFEASCSNCKSTLRFLRSDGKLTFDQRDGDFLTVACPVCGTSVNVAANKGKPPPPRPSR
ncbi:hypothetical protein [Sphingomonas soli]|uniref:hypothetical protein n=1 Tax=Sphingomonas soli TaxID=266127 RepID=UPI000835A4AF|nr:hypothetical protein [Sphingomonas soli]